MLNPTTLIKYIEACGGSDHFEFYDAAGQPDVHAAYEFKQKIVLLLPSEDCITQRNHYIDIKLEKLEVP